LIGWLKQELRDRTNALKVRADLARTMNELLKSIRQGDGSTFVTPVMTAAYREMSSEQIKELIFQRLSLHRNRST
jgi:hypothetical protein